MLYAMPEDQTPFTKQQHDHISVSVEDAGETVGFILTDGQASKLAINLLRTIAERSSDELPVHKVERFFFDARHAITRDEAARFVLMIGGAPLACTMNAERFSDFAAQCVAASKAIDRQFTPRPDLG